MTSRSRSPERVSFANIDETLPLPDLIASSATRSNGSSTRASLRLSATSARSRTSPVSSSLELEFDPTDADLRPPPKFTVEECREKRLTYSAPVFVRARFLNATTGEIKEQTVFMGDFPMMTDRGTFIVNGTERVVVSAVGSLTGRHLPARQDAKTVFTGTIHPYRGEWIELDIEAKPGKDVNAGCRVARKRRLSLFALLRALGPRRRRLLRPLRAPLRLPRRPVGEGAQPGAVREEALLEIYKRARPGEPLSAEAARVSTSRTPSSSASATT